MNLKAGLAVSVYKCIVCKKTPDPLDALLVRAKTPLFLTLNVYLILASGSSSQALPQLQGSVPVTNCPGFKEGSDFSRISSEIDLPQNALLLGS